jgi:hypothetical protein
MAALRAYARAERRAAMARRARIQQAQWQREEEHAEREAGRALLHGGHGGVLAVDVRLPVGIVALLAVVREEAVSVHVLDGGKAPVADAPAGLEEAEHEFGVFRDLERLVEAAHGVEGGLAKEAVAGDGAVHVLVGRVVVSPPVGA